MRRRWWCRKLEMGAFVSGQRLSCSLRPSLKGCLQPTVACEPAQPQFFLPLFLHLSMSP